MSQTKRNLIFDIDSYNEIPKFLRDSVIKPHEIIGAVKPMEDTAMTNLDPNTQASGNGENGGIATVQPTLEQMKKQREELDRLIQEKTKAGRQNVVSEIVRVMREFEVPIEDVMEALGGKAKRQGTPAKPKYRDPVSQATWSGRGKPPAWIKGIEDKTPFEIH